MREQIHLHLGTSWHLRSILNQLGSEKLRENMGIWHSRIFSRETFLGGHLKLFPTGEAVGFTPPLNLLGEWMLIFSSGRMGEEELFGLHGDISLGDGLSGKMLKTSNAKAEEWVRF